jgi:hypothetical protein
MHGRRQLIIMAFALVWAFTSPELRAANIVVDRLELLTYGALDETTGLFGVNSRLNFELSLGGGEKFAGLLRLDFLSTHVETDLSDLAQTLTGASSASATLARLNAPELKLKTVAVTAKRLFDSPLEAAYFVGYLDTFGSGDDFVTLFGASPFATQLRGPLFYPNGIRLNPTVSWDGIHAVYGTGLRVGYAPGDRARLYAYAYQDSDLGAGKWSGDVRGLLDQGILKLEVFGGGSYDGNHSLGLYRGGLLFFSAPGDIGEFYAQIGVPQYDPNTSFSVNDVFFLFEPRVNFEGGSQLALSVFYHPAYYRQKATGEAGALDVGFNLRFGRLADNGRQGGVESFLAFRPLESSPLTADISPYYEVIASGVAWNFKLGLRLFPFPNPWYGIFRPFVGVKTSY